MFARPRRALSVLLVTAATLLATLVGTLVGATDASAASRPAPGARIVKVARHYVGHVRYVYGGSTPKQGFDCSGYTRWVYRHAHVSRLPHNAEAQRHVKHMHRIPRSKARPGDLVFYLSGGTAYHVAVYAGHGKQYAATMPGQKIKYQPIWASGVEFRTNWH